MSDKFKPGDVIRSFCHSGYSAIVLSNKMVSKYNENYYLVYALRTPYTNMGTGQPVAGVVEMWWCASTKFRLLELVDE